MEPIIYTLPKSDKILKIQQSDVYFDNQPNPKLIKYGFNNINERIDLMEITSVPNYRVLLGFDFDRDDEKSMLSKASKLFGTDIDLTFAEFWEILVLFDLLSSDQQIITSHPDTVQHLVNAYQKISDTNNKYQIVKNPKKNVSLIVYKYSDIDIDENASIQLLINSLTNLISNQSKGAAMILQLFGLQTQISAELIYYLSTLYTEAYLYRPTISNDLSESKYIVLLGLKEEVNSPPISSNGEDTYLFSIGLNQIPMNIDTIIQCINAEMIPKKYKKYLQIKEYLDTKVYEGATYQEMLQAQNDNVNKWLSTFTDISKMKNLLDKSITKTSEKCGNYNQLVKILST